MPSTRPLLRTASVAITLALALPLGASAQQPATATTKPAASAAVPEQPLTNARVIAMVKKGVPEDAVVQAINAGNNRFELDSNSVMALAQSGVSRRIIDEMKGAAPDARRGLAATPGDRRAAAEPLPKKKMCVAVWCW